MLLTLILLFTLVHVSHVFSLKNTYILYMTIFSKERIEIHYRQLKKVRTATRIKIDPCGKTFLFVISVDDVATLLNNSMEKIGTLQWEDYLVIAVTLCISVGIGIYYRFSGGRQKTIEVYLSFF